MNLAFLRFVFSRAGCSACGRSTALLFERCITGIPAIEGRYKRSEYRTKPLCRLKRNCKIKTQERSDAFDTLTMCGCIEARYAMSWSEMWHLWQFKEMPVPTYNIKPSEPLIRMSGPSSRRTAELVTWGRKFPGITKTVINARSETIDLKPAFRGAFKNSRVVVPVSGWYEWIAKGRPHHFATMSSISLLAAIVADGRVFIATVEPNEQVAKFHDRMPVILHADDVDAWLLGSVGDAKNLLRPWDGTLDIFEVGTAVNFSQNKGPECLAPAKGQLPLF